MAEPQKVIMESYSIYQALSLVPAWALKLNYCLIANFVVHVYVAVNKILLFIAN